jgi:hypothetical protein
MTGPFKVGEVCIGQHFIMRPDRNGCECVVLTSARHMHVRCDTTGRPHSGPMVEVRWADGWITNVMPSNLRRKRPPAGEESILRMFDVTAPAPREVEAA